jgi:hypothetical protein
MVKSFKLIPFRIWSLIVNVLASNLFLLRSGFITPFRRRMAANGSASVGLLRYSSAHYSCIALRDRAILAQAWANAWSYGRQVIAFLGVWEAVYDTFLYTLHNFSLFSQTLHPFHRRHPSKNIDISAYSYQIKKRPYRLEVKLDISTGYFYAQFHSKKL